MLDNKNELVNGRFFSVSLRFDTHPALAFYRQNVWVEWSYGRLADRTREVAAYLKSLGVQRGSAVGVIATRLPDTIAAMIAILELGAHYVPLDPAYPQLRLKLLCKDARLKQIFSAVAICDTQRYPSPVHSLNGGVFERLSVSSDSTDGVQGSAESPAYSDRSARGHPAKPSPA